MPRISPVDPENTSGRTRQLLDGIQEEWGMTPNVFRTLANAPVALEGYLGLADALSRGTLGAELREQIAVAVAEWHRCDYSLAAHCAIARTLGLSEDAITDARRGGSPDRKVEAALNFARHMLDKQGWIDDDDVARLRDAGYGDREIVEIIANVAVSIFSNYFNHVAGTEVDFPQVPQLSNT